MNRYEKHMHQNNAPHFFVSRIDRMDRNGTVTRDELPHCIHMALALQNTRKGGDYGVIRLYIDRAFKLYSDWYRVAGRGNGSYWRGTHKPNTAYTLYF